MVNRIPNRLPSAVRRSLAKLGRDIGIARRKRRLTTAMMAERIGVSRTTYSKVERGDPTTAIASYAMSVFVLGLGTPLGDLVDAGRDDQALLLDVERLPARVRAKTQPTGL